MKNSFKDAVQCQNVDLSSYPGKVHPQTACVCMDISAIWNCGKWTHLCGVSSLWPEFLSLMPMLYSFSSWTFGCIPFPFLLLRMVWDLHWRLKLSCTQHFLWQHNTFLHHILNKKWNESSNFHLLLFCVLLELYLECITLPLHTLDTVQNLLSAPKGLLLAWMYQIVVKKVSFEPS